MHASCEINELLKDKTIVCDRYILSTLCYHRAVDSSFKTFDESNIDILQPDLTFYLTANYDVRMKRIAQRENIEFEDASHSNLHDESFQKKVELEFLKYEKLIWVDTNILSAEEVSQKILMEFCQ